jgi:lipoprotein-anchoring transpeptidase ErfK/SrfK
MGQSMIELPSAKIRPLLRASRPLFLAAFLLSLPMLASTAGAQALAYAPTEPGIVSGYGMTSAPAAQDEDQLLPARLRRTVVNLDTREGPGTVIVDTADTVLYYVLSGGRAIRYGIGVGRAGFAWSGVERVSRKAAWPDWYPPPEMIARQPYLPRFMAGGPGNPLGARAMYLGNSEYRIHGTNDPTTIGKFISSGCIRLTNEDVSDLFNRVSVGTKVVVLPKSSPLQARSLSQVPAPARPRLNTLRSGREALSIPLATVN